MARKRKSPGNGAVEALSHFLDHLEDTYGDKVFGGVSQEEFTEELLTFIWGYGYKVVPLDFEDLNDN